MKFGGSKEQILWLLYQDNSAKIEDLKETTGLGVTTLREHIEDLEENDLIEHEKISEGRGRPEHVYHLAESGRALFVSPDDSLSDILFKVLRKTLEPEKLQEVLRRTLFEYLQSSNQEIYRLIEEYGNDENG